MKRYRFLAMMFSAVMTLGCVSAEMPAAAAESGTELRTVRQLGTVSESPFNWFTEYGCKGDPSAVQYEMEQFPQLKASWESVTAPVASIGYSWIEENRAEPGSMQFSLRGFVDGIICEGECRIGFDDVLAVHGWFSEPRAEFYIAEAYVRGCSFLPDDQADFCGTVTLDNGETYRIYKTEKTGKTPFADSEPYLQYWSVRAPEAADQAWRGYFRLETELEPHFLAWAMLGMELGNCEQTDVRLQCDPDSEFPATGSLNLRKLQVNSCRAFPVIQVRDRENAEVPDLRRGDLNADGKVNAEDLSLFRCVWKPKYPEQSISTRLTAADMNLDQKLDARDLTLLKRYLLTQQEQPSSGRRLLFSDEFDGNAPDLSKWSYDLGNWKLDKNGNYITNGWGNNEQQFYTDKNASVKDGILTIAARHEAYTDEKQGSYEYTSAKLTTAQKFSVTGGRIEVRARCDAGKSLWPAIWMLPEEELYGGWAASGEIDIMEGWGSTPEKICGTIHFGGTWPDNRYLTADYHFPAGTSAADWHVYAVEWKKNCIQWYVDDQLYSTQTEWSADGYERPAPFDQDFYLILNLAVGGHFDGVDGIYGDPATFADGEKQFQIDYVRVYEPAEDFSRTSWASLPLELYTEGADAELHNSDSGTAVTVRSTGEKEYAVMALRRGIDVRADTAYNVVFDAACDQPRDMVVTVEDSAYHRLLDQKITLTPDKTHYAFAVTFPSDMAADLKFQLGCIGDAAALPAHTVTLSDVRFVPQS